jgi:hypothetical protein
MACAGASLLVAAACARPLKNTEGGLRVHAGALVRGGPSRSRCVGGAGADAAMHARQRRWCLTAAEGAACEWRLRA